MANLPPAAKPSWDWDLAFVLWCGGADYDQILAHPKFRGKPKSTLVSYAQRHNWKQRREALARLPQGSAVDLAAKSLQDNLTEAGISHQQFMLSELERERIIFGKQKRDTDSQGGRLQILKQLDDLARRTSKLDEQKDQNPVTQGFAILVHLQENTHKVDDRASTGILRSNNALVVDAEDPEITPIEEIPADRADEEVVEGLKAMPPASSLFGATPISKL